MTDGIHEFYSVVDKRTIVCSKCPVLNSFETIDAGKFFEHDFFNHREFKGYKKFIGAFVTNMEAMWKMSFLLFSKEYGNGFYIKDKIKKHGDNQSNWEGYFPVKEEDYPCIIVYFA